MGCTSCGSGDGGGCSSGSGGCGSGGGCNSNENFNQLIVTDWLANMTLPSGQKPYELIEVRFKSGRKEFLRNTKELSIFPGETVVVEAAQGYDVGIVSLTGELVKIQQEKKMPGSSLNDFKKIHRIATQEDIDKWKIGQGKETDLIYQSRKLASELKLEMKISDVEYQGDLTKATFYYTAEGRVDFRQLIKNMADLFKVKIEMRQIGARQEAARIGGISSSGRELCSSSWITDFRSVSTSAARYQQLSLNPQKLAGQCGKLKCCLNFELDMYLDGLKKFPSNNARLKTEAGEAFHIKTDIFKKLMWYAVPGSNSLIGLSPESVVEIIELNKKGTVIKDLKEYEAELKPSTGVVVEKIGFVSLDEDESFNRLAKALTSKPKKGNRNSSNKNKNRSRNRKPEGNKNAVPNATREVSAKKEEKGNNPNAPAAAKKPNRNRNKKRSENQQKDNRNDAGSSK